MAEEKKVVEKEGKADKPKGGSNKLMLIVIVLALLTGVAGALYPAVYAMRIRAVEALRFE